MFVKLEMSQIHPVINIEILMSKISMFLCIYFFIHVE